MKKWQQNIVLFDLDGTLTDSAEGIIRSVQHMQEKTGREVWEAEKLGFIVGPPLRDSFRDAFGMKTEEEIDNAVAVFRERYFSVGLFENAVYPGVKEMLEELKKMGYDVAGPVGADSVFHQAAIGKYNSVLSLYHDQGHIATKTLDFEKTIAITNGMPILRTSVDHGTAFDIAGTGKVSAVSMIEAIRLAAKYAPHFVK